MSPQQPRRQPRTRTIITRQDVFLHDRDTDGNGVFDEPNRDLDAARERRLRRSARHASSARLLLGERLLRGVREASRPTWLRMTRTLFVEPSCYDQNGVTVTSVKPGFCENVDLAEGWTRFRSRPILGWGFTSIADSRDLRGVLAPRSWTSPLSHERPHSRGRPNRGRRRRNSNGTFMRLRVLAIWIRPGGAARGMSGSRGRAAIAQPHPQVNA